MAQVGGGESEATLFIWSQEDLQRAIDLGTWYDSEEEDSGSDVDLEDTDSGPSQSDYPPESEVPLLGR